MPEHVFYWSPETARKVLEEKFEILEIKRAGQFATGSFLFRRLGSSLSARGSFVYSFAPLANNGFSNFDTKIHWQEGNSITPPQVHLSKAFV